MKLKKPRLVTCAVFALAFAANAGATELLTNGDFETGSFAGWSNNTLPTSDPLGGIFIDTPGTTTPSSGLPTAANAGGGSFYAVSDQGGPGTYSLLQSFTIPVGATSVVLTFDMFVNDHSGSGPIVDPIGLDHTGPANQHARVDILTSTATAFSTVVADIVSNLYIGNDPGQPPNPYTSYSFDITGATTPGSTYQVRFAETDNQGFFNMGVDNVSIQATRVPIPATVALLGLGLAAVGFSKRWSA